jgi:hypothetical protein
MSHKNVTDIISQVAVEVGLNPTADPFAEGDPAYQQMIYLCNSSGIELLQSDAWGELRREYTFTVPAGNDGTFALPDDFRYMIDQTGWERRENVPLFGPASPQQWQYLLGRDLVSSTIYAIFRLTEGKLYLFPQPAPEGLEIAYEYISDNWVADSAAPGNYDHKVKAAGDIVLYEPHLFERLLKYRFLQARGFDTTAAQQDYYLSLNAWAGKDKSAPVLNAGTGGWQYPYLDSLSNTPDSGYG